MTSPPPQESDAEKQDRSRAPTLAGSQAEERSIGASLELARGANLGRYLVLDVLGRGGMGTVYKAYDPELDRAIAIKLVALSGQKRSPEKNQRSRARLLREAQALAKLSHPNVVGVHDVGTLGEDVFVAMELVEGETLRSWLAAAPRTYRETLRVLCAAGRGLSAAHARQIVHRDFKPDNVMIGQDGRVRVIDFGLVRGLGPSAGSASGSVDEPVTDPPAVEEPDPSGSVEDETSPGAAPGASGTGPRSGSSVPRSFLNAPITRYGAVVGTPLYMAPEQHVGDRADARSDQFSFSVVLHEALYGQHPFEAKDEQHLALAVFNGRVRPPPEKSPVPSWIHRVLLRGLAVEPANRYPGLEGLLQDLERDPHALRKRGGTLFALLLLVALAGWGLWSAIFAGALHCQGSAAKLEAVWNKTVQKSVREAFLRSGLAYAAETFQRVEGLLDRHAIEWARMAKRACEATWVKREQTERLFDLSNICLGEKLQDLDALVRVFRRADQEVVENAVQAASQLGSLAPCADAGLLVSLAERVPPPRDEPTRKRVEEIRAQVKEARALEASGKYPEGLVQADQAARQAAALGYAPLLAEALYSQAALQEREYQFATSRKTLDQAWMHAEVGRHDEVRVLAGTLLVWVLGYDLNRYDEALRMGEMTGAILGRLSGPIDELRIRWFNIMGATLVAKGDLGPGKQHYQKSLALAEKSLGPESLLVGVASNNLGLLSVELADYERALSYFRRDFAITEKLLGRMHPYLITSLDNMTNAYLKLGELGPAEELIRQAEALSSKALGLDHPLRASILNNRAVLTMARENWDEALALLREALSIHKAKLGTDSTDFTLMLMRLGLVLMEKGQFSEAGDSIQRSLEIVGKIAGRDNIITAVYLNALGELERRTHRRKSASEHYLAALRNLEMNRPGHPEAASSLLGLGLVSAEEGDDARAREHLKRASSICERSPCPPSLQVRIWFTQAKMLWQQPEDRRAALALAVRARERFVFEGVQKSLFAEIDSWIQQHQEK